MHVNACVRVSVCLRVFVRVQAREPACPWRMPPHGNQNWSNRADSQFCHNIL